MEDIVFSIMRHKEERVLSTVRQLAGNFKAAKADGPDTIILELHEPDVDIPITLRTFPFTIVKSQTYDFNQPIGTGPIVVTELAPGVRPVCAPNPTYCNSGPPNIDDFEIFPILAQVGGQNPMIHCD